MYHVRTKHIDISFHFVREILDGGDIELQKIHTKENPVDMHTKVVSRVKFVHCKELLMSFKLLELGGGRLDELRIA